VYQISLRNDVEETLARKHIYFETRPAGTVNFNLYRDLGRGRIDKTKLSVTKAQVEPGSKLMSVQN
jgi:hypothetical protein